MIPAKAGGGFIPALCDAQRIIFDTPLLALPAVPPASTTAV